MQSNLYGLAKRSTKNGAKFPIQNRVRFILDWYMLKEDLWLIIL